MEHGSAETVRRELDALFNGGSVSGLSDDQLLERFVGRGDEAARLAFEAVVSRHGPMVLGVCRRVLGDAHAAEDVFQATFLVLAFKAGSVRKREALGPWLHGVASRLARRSHRVMERRKAESPLPEGLAAAGSRDDLRVDVRGVLDEELGRLPDRYRRPVVLCYLEGKTQEEAARELGWTKGTVSGRLARAKDLLRSRLIRRGVTPAVGLVGLGVASEGLAVEVPTALVSAAVRGVAAMVLGRPEMVSPSGAVSSLARHALRGMVLGKIKVAAGLVLVLGMFAGAYGVVSAASQDQPRPEVGRAAARVEPALVGKPHEAPLPQGAQARMGTTRLRHEGTLNSVVFSPDGRTLASTGWDGAVRFWDPRTGEAVAGLGPLREPHVAFNVAYSPDGKLLAVGRDQGLLQLWDVVARRERFRSRVHKGRVQGLVFTPDGRVLISASDDERCVRFWDVTTGTVLRTLTFDEKDVYLGRLALSPDGTKLALGIASRAGRKETIRIWDLPAGGDPVVIRGAHDGKLSNLAFLKNGNTLISGGARFEMIREGGQRYIKPYGQIRAWDVRDGRMLHDLELPDDTYSSEFALSADGTFLVSMHREKVLVWDIATWKVRRSVTLGKDAAGLQIEPVDLSPDGRVLAFLRYNHSIYVMDMETGKPRFSEDEGHGNALLSVALTPDGRQLVSSDVDGAVRIWKTANGDLLRQPEMEKRGWARSTRISPDGRTMAASSEILALKSSKDHGMARLWDFTTGRLLREWRFQQRARRVEFSPDSRKLAVVTHTSEDDRVRLPADDSGTLDDTIHVFDVGDGRVAAKHPGKVQTLPLAKLLGHTREVLAVAFTEDGGSIVSASEDMTFRFWDLATSEQTRQIAIEGHIRVDPGRLGGESRVCSAVFSADLKTAITSALSDDQLIIWDLVAGKAVRSIRVDKLRGATLAISPDGRLFASASRTSKKQGDDDTVQVWEVASGREILRLPTGVPGPRPLAFSADGSTLAAGLPDTTALVWDISAALATAKRPDQ